MVNDLERRAREEAEQAERELAGEEEKTGVSKYLPALKNPFKRAEA
jgi:hypothetical protein